MNNEIKYIVDELGIIYDFYQDQFSLKRIKTYILSMPEGSKIITVSAGKVPIYDHEVVLPIAEFNDHTDSVSLLQVNHTMINSRSSEIIAEDSNRIIDLVDRLIKLIEPK
ncbi:hypothetical protein FC72_GL001614 [Companilactobacillus tucceti DSM 20183]|uniref:Uncharacterized protein n=1 Tax=Companilactobacillus tucceti DSM 20183 TaxID=1423811 RepID=A0A0R1J1M3_9LACO|nr:hypothetical protein [Companilactobacillus tucceti]KRK65238.1 hypothetical protein FC72_GL001614 [Companilactobacillus tucceti DSM 20183]